jgi:hypothetical protein
MELRMPKRAQRARGLVPFALLAAALSAGSPAAHAWEDGASTEAIEKMLQARSREALAGRASPVEGVTDAGNDELRPQQRSFRGTLPAARPHALRVPTGVRLASLGSEALPMSLPLPAGAELPATARLPGQEDASPGPGATLASLGRDFPIPGPSTEPSLSGATPIRWVASADCLAAPLRAVLAEVAAKFGPVRVNSTCRSKRHNARVGGAPRSYHLTGNAADFRISGTAVKEVHAFLSGKRVVGGLKHYGFGVFHIDTGPRRTWGNKSWGKKSWSKKRSAKRRRAA